MPLWLVSIGKWVIANLGKYALIGVGAWFLYGEVRTIVGNFKQEQKNIGELNQIVKDQVATLEKKEAEIAAAQVQLDIQRAANARNSEKIVEITNENDDFRERIQRHDIDAIIARRGSEVVERAYTRGSNTVFRVWNEETAALEQYGIDRQNDLSSTLIPDPATSDPDG